MSRRRQLAHTQASWEGLQDLRAMPIEQPTRIEFVVNRSTAKKLGLEMPQSVLLRADEVIE